MASRFKLLELQSTRSLHVAQELHFGPLVQQVHVECVAHKALIITHGNEHADLRYRALEVRVCEDHVFDCLLDVASEVKVLLDPQLPQL